MIKIIVVGKLKEKYFIDAQNEYLKRLNKYTNIKLIEVNDENYDIKKTLSKEKDNIIKYIDNKDYIVSLDIDGEELSSVQLSNKINNMMINNSNITFIIGGSYGLDNYIKNISNYRLSFSKLTFPHQLFRIMLLEQIYRSFKILNNETYHK